MTLRLYTISCDIEDHVDLIEETSGCIGVTSSIL